MNRSLVIAAAAAATLFTATAANANRVNWSIGINVPPVATYVSGGPAYYQQPAYYQAPGYYAAPVYPAYDRWHDGGDRDGHRDGGHDRGHDGRVDWRR